MSDLSIDSLSDSSVVSASSLFDSPSLTPVEEATDKVARAIIHQDPTIATIQFGLQFEAHSTKKLEKMEANANRIMQSIDLLLDLSEELSSVDEANPTLSEKATAALKKLKENGMTLMDEGAAFTKEKLISLKSNISVRIDKLRTEVQQVFTKIQTIIQYMSSVNDTVKRMISEHSDFMRKISERCLKR